MSNTVQVRQVPEQPIAVVHGHSAPTEFPKRIRALFDQFYADFKGKGGLNIVTYSACDGSGDFEIACGVQVESGGNASTPGGRIATTTHIGPYNQMAGAHDAIHQWAKETGTRLAGPSWEVYGHWNDDPAQLRTDIFYLLSE